MAKKIISPDYIFEVSWEVCNKVGGIYTVVSTKAPGFIRDLGDNYIFIGPDVWKETHRNPYFVQDDNLYKSWVEAASRDGLKIRIGRFKTAGDGIAILVDFTQYFTQKDQILATFWEKYGLDSLTGQWDYLEPLLFGYASGKVIESFYEHNLTSQDRIIAQFHEWMTGAGILYIKDKVPQIGTVFTTHATVAGRSAAGNGWALYRDLNHYNPDQVARELGIMAKYSLEKSAAVEADIFTTVSEITAAECKKFFGREVDFITPNGFDEQMILNTDTHLTARKSSREILTKVSSALLGEEVRNDAFFIVSSGRYEFRNKGLDLFVDTISKASKLYHGTRQIIAWIMVPANQSGARKEILDTISSGIKSPMGNRILTHGLFEPEHDHILTRLKNSGFDNSTGNVKLIFVPAFLDGFDGLFNKTYYELLPGFDLSVFPSYYEPWGYTPLESIAFGVPTITTTFAGFGAWIKTHYGDKLQEVRVLNRTEENYWDLSDQLARTLSDCAQKSPEEAAKVTEKSFKTAAAFTWSEMNGYYKMAYNSALYKADSRSDKFRYKKAAEVVPMISRKASIEPEWRKVYVDPAIPERLSGLVRLSKNIWWTWNYDAIELFEVIDKELWYELKSNPIAMIEALPYDVLKSLELNPEFLEKLDSVMKKFDDYMEAGRHAQGGSVAYFSMEYGLHDTVRIYSGGLGMLAGDYLKEASDTNKNMIAVGLLYRYGYFNQEISTFGDQIAKLQPQKFTHMPLLPVRNENGDWIVVSLALPGRVLYAKVWRLDVGRIPLFLLDTDIHENSDTDRTVTHQLYGGDWENRLKQELLLGVGGIRLLKELNINPDIFHLNEGHAAFSTLERLKDFVQNEKLSFYQAMEVVRATTLFTTHTPVPAGHDSFSEDLLRAYIPHYADRLNISWETFMNMGRKNRGDVSEKFSVSILAINLAQEVNGVSRIHGRVSREMFTDLFPGYFADELHIGYVTNGVHFPTWTAKSWQQFYAKHFGEDYIYDQSNPEYWKKIYQVSDDEIWAERIRQKQQMIQYIRKRVNEDMTRRQDNPKMIFKTLDGLRSEALTIGFARRFATYKRAHLLFSNLERLSKIVNNPRYPVQFIFAGKAHPHDNAGQDLIKRIMEIAKMPEFVGRILFIENYDIELAKFLVRGVDVWLNTPTRPLEASGTSGEKAVMNGVANFSVLDGWWAEGYKPGAGWAIKEEQTYDNHQFQDELDAEIIYNTFEEEIIPTYYDTSWNGISSKWIAHIKNTIAHIAPNFTMKRMIDDYYNLFYSKLFIRGAKLLENDFENARLLAAWKRRMVRAWDDIHLIKSNIHNSSGQSMKQGDQFHAELFIETGEIKFDEIGIEVVFGRKVNGKVQKILFSELMKGSQQDDNTARFECNVNITNAGVYDFAFRLFPVHPLLPHRQDFKLLRWL